MKEQRKLAAVMFTDIAGYTALMSKDEQQALALLQKNRDLQKSLAAKHNGEFLKEMGDGTLLCFQSALDAVQCAMEIQESVKDDPDLNLRIGIHLGDIVFKDGDVFGDGVNVASRIEKLAETGGICISGQIYKTVKNKPGIDALLLGEKRLKNVDDPVTIYALTGEGLPEPSARSFHADYRKKSLLLVLIPVGVLLILAITFFVLIPYLRTRTNDHDTHWQNSIAVLSFVDMSPEKDQEYFCDGMAEEIINALVNIDKLQVIARTSSFAFKGEKMDVCEIGKKLGVETLLEGSVRKAGNQLRVTAQLVRTSDGFHLWSRKFNRNLPDVFAIQDEITLAIVNQLKIKLLGGEKQRIETRHTQHLEAYNTYLRGRHLLNRRKREDLYKSISYFEKALQLDSLYVLGYIGLADAYALLPTYASAPPQMAYPKAKEAVLKALEINDQVGEAYASLGWIKILADWDWDGAERAFERAVSLSPGYATAYHWYGYMYMIQGKFDQSIPKVIKALDLDPLSPVINRVIGDVYYYARQYDRAIPALEKTLELEPCITYGHQVLGLCYLRKAMYDEALSEFAEEKTCRIDSIKVNYLIGATYSEMGEVKKAMQILEGLEKRDAKGFGMAVLYFELGKSEQGFEMLEHMVQEHDTWLIYIKTNPGFDKIRSDPRYKALLKRIGLD